jgi:hypothetical protein
LSNAIITQCIAGVNNYTVATGYRNMLYSVIPAEDDKPEVFIGLPFRMAQSIIN